MDFILAIVKFLICVYLLVVLLLYSVSGIIILIEKKILTKKRFFIFISIVLFLIGFVYNYLILGGSFLSGLEGGSVLMSIVLIISAIVFLTNRDNHIIKNK